MRIEIRPGADEGKATVFVGGMQVGMMWLTTRGACYQQTNREFILSRDDMQTLVTAMQAAELLGMESAQ